MTTDTPFLSDMLLEITRGHADALKADPTLAARLDAQNGTGLPALNAETVFAGKPNLAEPVYEGGPDGPIREPGDEVPRWHDVYTAAELVAALNYQATRQAKAGATHIAEELTCAAEAIADMSAKLDTSREVTQRLLTEIAQLRREIRESKPAVAVRCEKDFDCTCMPGHEGECDVDPEMHE